MPQRVEVARRFLTAVTTVRAAVSRFARVQEEVKDELYRHVPLPMPSFLAAVTVEARCLWVPPPALRHLLRIDLVHVVSAVALDGRIYVYLKDSSSPPQRSVELLLHSRSASWLELVTVAMIHDHLLRCGVDILAQLEEGLGRPGFFEELRTLLQSIAATVTPLLGDNQQVAQQQAVTKEVVEVDEALVQELAAAVEGRMERGLGLGWGLNRLIDIYLPAPIQEEVRVAVEPPLELPQSIEQLLDERLPQSIEELFVRAEGVGGLGRIAVYVRGRGGESKRECKLLLEWLGDAAAAVVIWYLLEQQRGIDFLFILRRRIEEATEGLSLLKAAKEVCRIFGVIQDG